MEDRGQSSTSADTSDKNAGVENSSIVDNSDDENIPQKYVGRTINLTIEEALSLANTINFSPWGAAIVDEDGIYMGWPTIEAYKNLKLNGFQVPYKGDQVRYMYDSSLFVMEDGSVYYYGEQLFSGSIISFFTVAHFDEFSYYVGITNESKIVGYKVEEQLGEMIDFGEQKGLIMICQVRDFDEQFLCLYSDGTVKIQTLLGNFENRYDSKTVDFDVSSWSNIALTTSGRYYFEEEDTEKYYAVGLKKDGTVVGTGAYPKEIDGWTDIVYIASAGALVYGLAKDGSVKAALCNNIEDDYDYIMLLHQLEQLHDIVAISAFNYSFPCYFAYDTSLNLYSNEDVTLPYLVDCDGNITENFSDVRKYNSAKKSDWYTADDGSYEIKYEGIGQEAAIIDFNLLVGSDLAELVIPDTINEYTITSVASHAFEDASIERIILPSTLKYIDSSAFYKSRIGDVIIPDSVVYMGNCVFLEANVGSVTLSAGLLSSPADTFHEAEVSSVTIPGSLPDFDLSPYGIDRSTISDVYFNGSESEWHGYVPDGTVMHFAK